MKSNHKLSYFLDFIHFTYTREISNGVENFVKKRARALFQKQVMDVDKD